MKTQSRIMSTALVASMLAGCGGGFGGAKTRLALSAVPLDPFSTVTTNGNGKCNFRREDPTGKNANHVTEVDVDCTNFEKAHIVAYESQTKCNEFITRMFAANAATNTRLDLLTTFLTSVASVTTPTRAAHTLTAGAAISSGTKLSISNEYFTALTISHIVQTIQQSYSTDMASYLEGLDKMPDSERGRISFIAEIPRIQAIHGECSLAAAEATIATTLQVGGTASNKPADSPVVYATSYTVIHSETNKEVAKGIAMALNANLDLGWLTVAADVDSVTKTKVNLKRTDTNVALDWSAAVAPTESKLKIEFAKDFASFTVSGTAAEGDVATVTAAPHKATATASTTTATTPTTNTPRAAPDAATRKVAVPSRSLQLRQ